MNEVRLSGNPTPFRSLPSTSGRRRGASFRHLADLHRFLVLGAGLAMIALSPEAVSGQPKIQYTPQIIEVAIKAGNELAALKDVDLRPNTATELAFELKNLAGEFFADVTVKLVQVVDGKDLELAEAKNLKLAKAVDKEPGLIVAKFEKIKGGPEKLELTGLPPFKLQLHIQGKDLPLSKRDLKLVIREPRDYVSPTAKFDPADGELRVVVKPNDEKAFIGPHLLPAQLVLGPDIKPTKKGIFKQTLTGPDQKLALIAEDIAFERMLAEADAYLKVDGYERAFIYQVRENAKGAINPRPAGDIRVRISVPRFAKPNAKFVVPLEVDGPLTGDYKVQVGLSRTGENDEIEAPDLQVFDGLRQQKVTLSVSKEGKLICQSEVSDWRAQFDTSDILGRNIWFIVSVVTMGDKGKYDKKVKLTIAAESRPQLARTKTNDPEKDVSSVFAMVTQDISPPEGIKLELPKDKEWTIGTPLELRASIKERTPSQAPIEKVILFRGKVPKDEKIKDDDILETIESLDPKEKEWKITLLPQAKPEPLTLSVQFTTVTGVKASGGTDTIFFKPAAAAAKKLYMIKGQVVRGELGQPDVQVTLLDAKRNEKATTKTKAKGAFVFENVEPGAYIVASQDKSFQDLSGETNVNVPDKDKELKVTVSLLRKK